MKIGKRRFYRIEIGLNLGKRTDEILKMGLIMRQSLIYLDKSTTGGCTSEITNVTDKGLEFSMGVRNPINPRLLIRRLREYMMIKTDTITIFICPFLLPVHPILTS